MKTSIPLFCGAALTLLAAGCSGTGGHRTPDERFEHAFMTILPRLDDQHELHIKFASDTASRLVTPVFFFMPCGESAAASKPDICSGSGLELAKCCEQWLGADPGKCMTVRGGRGVFHATAGC